MDNESVESPLFKHQQVEAELRQLVATLPVGGRMPAERNLAVQYGCNFLTVRRALKQLVDEKLIVRRIGSGTFVARHEGEAGTASSGAGGAGGVARPARDRVGVLVWQGGDAYAYRVLQGLAHEALALQVDLRSGWVRNFAAEGLQQARLLGQEGCAALTLPWFPHDRVEEVRAFVRASPLPVSLPMVIPGLESNCFERQEIFGNSLQVSAEQLCAYFQVLGRRRIALLGPDAPNDGVLHRLLGAYACYTSRAGLPNHCGLVRSGAAAMGQLAERWREFAGDLAVISYDDEHALRFMTAMHKLGLSAPGDFQIVGHNNTEASAFSDPPLSTICQNFNYVGHWLIRSALGLARGEVAQSAALPPPRMLVRATCGGAGRIDEAFRERLPSLDIVVEGPEGETLA